MKYILRILTLLLFAPMFLACDNWSENTNLVLVDTLATGDSVIDPLAGYSTRFKKLMLTDTAVFRGRKFGMSKASVLESSLEKIEEDATITMYNISLDATEYGDISYGFNLDALIAIEVILYTKDDSSLVAFKNELVDFYGKKMGATVARKKDKTILLNVKENYGIEWTEEGNKVVKDLRMRIFSLSTI
jgi:hypothetical protein